MQPTVILLALKHDEFYYSLAAVVKVAPARRSVTVNTVGEESALDYIKKKKRLFGVAANWRTFILLNTYSCGLCGSGEGSGSDECIFICSSVFWCTPQLCSGS